jgi:hypothetical protein
MPRHAQQPRVRRRRAAPRADAATPSTAISDEFLGVPATVAWPAQGLDIVLPSVDLGRSTPCMLVQSAGQASLGLIQVCTWASFSPEWADANAGAQVPVLIWNTSGAIQPVPQAQGGFPGTPVWNVSGSDKYYAADVDGDGVDEIFASQQGRIGVFKWSGGALCVWWSASGAAGLDGASTWWPMTGDGYLPVQFGLGTASGSESLFAWSPDGGLAVLAWQGNGFNAVWSAPTCEVPGTTGAGWIIESEDAWWSTDVAGQGFDSILLSRPGAAMGLVQWDADAQAPSLVWSADLNLCDTNGAIAWPLQSNDQYAPADIDLGAPWAQSLVLFNPGNLTVAVAQFNNDPDSPQLQVVWSASQAIPNDDGGADLPLTSSDVLQVAVLQAYNPTVLFTHAGSVGAVYWGGDALIVLWTQQASSFPGAGGTGAWWTQGDSYRPVAGPAPGQQQLLACKPGSTGNLYGLLAFDVNGNVGCGWQTQDGSTPAAFPGWNLALVAGAPDVIATLPSSGDDPGAENDLYTDLMALAKALNQQMDADLAHVVAMVAPDSSGAPQVTFSWPNLLSALPSSCTSLASANAPQGSALSLLVSVLPPALMHWQLPTQTLDYTQLASVIDKAFANLQQDALLQGDIMGNDVKCALIAALVQQGAWAWPQPAKSGDDVNSEIAAGTQAGNRLQFYAVVIPAAYTIYYEQTSFSHLRGERWVKTPSWAQWMTTIGDEPWVYAIATGDNMLMDFPSQDMMGELLPAVPPAAFYLGQGIWAGLRRDNW